MKHHYLYFLLTIVLLSSCKKEPDACFEHEVVGSRVNFDATCSLHAAAYLWDFGDGGSSTIATPQHTFAGSGDHDVTLTVESKGGKTSSRTINVTITSNGSVALNTNFDGLYSTTETCTTGTRAYTVVVSPNAARSSEATFNGLWFTGGAVTAVIDAGATTFSIARQQIQSGKDIVSTSGTINSNGTRIDLSYQILQSSGGAILDECTAVLTR